jgi:alpha-1,2-mannosyltransferase
MDFSNKNTVKLYIKICFAVFLIVTSYFHLIIYCYSIASALTTRHGLTDIWGKPIGSDFVTFWAASKLVRSGGPVGVYSISKLYEVEKAIIGANILRLPWFYPPFSLLLVFPLSFLPYVASFALWICVTFWGYLKVVKRIAPSRLTAWLLLAFPGVVANLYYGQNGYLSGLLLGGGLLLLDSHPLVGGFLLGMLSYKPQLALLIPIALVAGRRWQALAGAAITSAALVLVSFASLGYDTWAAFWNTIPLVRVYFDNKDYWSKMPTVFASVRLMGASFPVAMLIQGVVTLSIFGAVSWVWQRRGPLVWQGAILTVGIFLAPPYAYEYDLALLGLAFAWLGWEEVTQGRLYGQGFLILCWMGLSLVTFVRPLSAIFQPTPLILMVLLVFILYRASQSGHTKHPICIMTMCP